jgi:hypothetical protein
MDSEYRASALDNYSPALLAPKTEDWYEILSWEERSVIVLFSGISGRF